MNLLIVESPSKAKTIQKYLGNDFLVVASYGHLIDLPKSQLGVDIEDGFKPTYQVMPGQSKIINQLKKLAKEADKIYLATDPDREGEAIAWHIQEQIDKKAIKTSRVVFNEITKNAILDSVQAPRQVDNSLFESQQARRILDRLVGYQISPVLWKKIKRGLSAGRVQSAALKLIVDRQREIDKFQAEEYWNIDLDFSDGENIFSAKLIDQKILNKASAEDFKQKILKQDYFKVVNFEESNKNQNPPAPFTTSTLQQTANSFLNFPVKKTMAAAQKLYEAGLITYMRTDSIRISSKAIGMAAAYIKKQYGENYLQTRQFSNSQKNNVQDAHEAIRPTQLIDRNLSGDLKKVYDLIFNRFISSQLKPAIINQQSALIESNDFKFQASGQKLIFDGFYRLTNRKIDGQVLPELTKNQVLQLKKIDLSQSFTKAPAAYSEASLIKKMEALGIGRPSTYSPTIETLKNRNYIQIEKKKIRPTEIGGAVNQLMETNFNSIIDADFTSKIEKQLDDIETGSLVWQEVIKNFYDPLNNQIKLAEKSQPRISVIVHEETSKEDCQICGAVMVKRKGKYGVFLACSRYPDCTYIKNLKKKRFYKKSAKSSK